MRADARRFWKKLFTASIDAKAVLKVDLLLLLLFILYLILPRSFFSSEILCAVEISRCQVLVLISEFLQQETDLRRVVIYDGFFTLVLYSSTIIKYMFNNRRWIHYSSYHCSIYWYFILKSLFNFNTYSACDIL